MNELTLALKLQIIKGQVGHYALSCSEIYNISNSGLARVLREIAEELEK